MNSVIIGESDNKGTGGTVCKHTLEGSNVNITVTSKRTMPTCKFEMPLAGVKLK